MHDHPTRSATGPLQNPLLPGVTLQHMPVPLPALTDHLASDEEPALQRARIAEKAYFSAQRRHFIGGDAIRDWLDAERDVLAP